MKQTRQTMAHSGSLTPELEGAQRTAAHPAREQPVKATLQNQKGGTQHEQ